MSAEIDADRLMNAMKGAGTREAELIAVLGKSTRSYIHAVCQAFEHKYKLNFVKEATSETSGHFRELLTNLAKPLPYYLAEQIEEAVKGAGTKEAVLIDILAPLNPQEMQELKDAYANLYGAAEGALSERVSKDVSGNFGKAMRAIIDTKRSADDSRVAQEAELLYKAGEKKLGTDEDTFISVVSQRTPEHLAKVSAHHKSISSKHHTLEEAIKGETSGHFEDLLIALMTPRPVYFAQRIHHAVAGLGTNDELLVRMFALNDKPHLLQIVTAYKQLYGTNLIDAVKGDTSGDYRGLLAALLE